MYQTVLLINVNFTKYRVFGRLVLIPFLEGRRSPNGLDAQQKAEIRAEEVFIRASSAIGMLVGLSQTLDHILKVRVAEISKAMAQTCPEMDDRCRKNYAVLISLAEKVWNTEMTCYHCKYYVTNGCWSTNANSLCYFMAVLVNYRIKIATTIRKLTNKR